MCYMYWVTVLEVIITTLCHVFTLNIKLSLWANRTPKETMVHFDRTQSTIKQNLQTDLPSAQVQASMTASIGLPAPETVSDPALWPPYGEGRVKKTISPFGIDMCSQKNNSSLEEL